MKKSYEVYEIGSDVVAISEYHKDGKALPFIAIYDAIVRTAYVDTNKKTGKVEISYWLATPEGEDWGDSVDADRVSDNVDDLVEVMKPIWKLNSNNHGEE